MLEALRWYRLAAEAGQPLAGYAVGSLLLLRPGRFARHRQNPCAGTVWRRTRVSPRAEFGLGAMYKSGEGVARNLGEAARLHPLGSGKGQRRRAVRARRHVLIEGDGVPKDPAEAARWFHRAAESGHGQAQFNLGLMYENGEEGREELRRRGALVPACGQQE